MKIVYDMFLASMRCQYDIRDCKMLEYTSFLDFPKDAPVKSTTVSAWASEDFSYLLQFISI